MKKQYRINSFSGSSVKFGLSKNGKNKPFIQMSTMTNDYPAISNEEIENSECAKTFYDILKKACGITAVASYIYHISSSPQINIRLWVKDNEASEKILNHKPHASQHIGDPYYDAIVGAFLLSLEKVSPEKYAYVTDLYHKQKRNGKHPIYIYASVFSFDRTYLDNLHASVRETITKRLNRDFPQYNHLSYESWSVQPYDTYNDPLLMFFTPQDKQVAEENGDIEKMKDICYEEVKKQDVRGLLSKNSYRIQVHSRREFTSEQLVNFAFRQ